MHTQRKTKVISVIIAVFVAAIACVVGFGLAMSSPHFDDRNRGLYSADRVDATDPSPRRQYSSLSVEFQSGLLAYVGITKVGDLKKGITVKGTYLAGGLGDKTVVLDDSEYVININDVSYNDNDYVYYADETIPSNFNCSVSCGTASAAVGTLEVKNPFGTFTDENEAANNKIPKYDSLKIELPEDVSTVVDTHDANSLKKLIVVKGVVDTTEEVIANKELLDITVGGSFSSGQKVNVSATYKYDEIGENLTSNAPSGNSDFTVSAAKLSDVHVAVKNDIKFISGTWVKSDTFHAFVSGMNNARVAESLDVFYEYDQNTYKHVVVGGAVSGAGYNSFTVTNNNFEGVSGSTAVNVALYNNSIGDGRSASITLNFETQRILKISAVHDNAPANLTSSTAFNKNHFTVKSTYNNMEEGSVLSPNEYTVTPATYAPSSQNIKETEIDATYKKDVRIALADNSDIFVDIKTADIKFVEPDGIATRLDNVEAAPQTVLTPFNYSGLTTELYYGDDSATIFLSEFETSETNGQKWLSIEFLRTGDDTPVEYTVDKFGRPLVPSIDITRVKITFKFFGKGDTPIGTSTRTFNSISVSPAEIDIPNLSVVEMDYSNNCFKQIRGIDFEKVAVNNVSIGKFDVEVSVVGDSNKVVAKYDVDKTDSEIVGEKLTTAFASYEKSTGKITFLRGGTFTVVLRINNENFGWKNTGTSNPSRNGTSELVYTIVVNKAELNIRLDGDKGTSKINLTYGDLKDSGGNTQFNGWESRVHYSIMGSSTYITNDTAENKPSFQLLYYGFTSADGKTTYTYSRKVDSDGNFDISSFSKICPKDVTSTGYRVAVYTPGNKAYKQSLMLLNNVVTVTVEPKELSVNIDDTSIIADKDYARKEYILEDFVKVPDEVKGKFWEYADGDALLKIESASLLATSDKPAAKDKPEEGYIHADTYGVKLTLLSNNYVWKDESGKTADDDKYSYLEERFQIKKISFSFEAEAADFIYGDTEKAGPKYDTYSNKYRLINYKKIASDKTETDITSDNFSDFFPVIADAAYYKAADFNTSTNSPFNSAEPLDVTKADEWDAGDYYIYFATSYREVPKSDTDPTVDLTRSDTKANFDLPMAFKKFTVSPREVERVTIADQTKSSDYPSNITYKGADIEFELENYNADIMKFGIYDAETKTFTDNAFDGVTGEETDPINITDAELTEKTETPEGSAEAVKKYYIHVKHAANYTVWIAFQNPNNYKWKPVPPTEGEGDGEEGGSEGDDTPITPEVSPHDPIDLGFTVFQRTIEWSTEKENDNYQYQYLGDGTPHDVPSFVAEKGSVTAADYLAIKYKAYTKNDFDPSTLVKDVEKCGVGTYYFEFYFELGDGTCAVTTDYKFGVMPTEFVVLAAELLKPTLKADAENTYKGADFAATDFLTPDKDNTSFAGLDIFVINSSGVKSVIRTVGKYTIHVKPKDNYSWGSVTEDKKQEEITFDIEIQQAAVTIDWSKSTLEFTYDGKSHTTVAGVTDVFSPDGVLDDVKVVIRVGETEESATDDGVTDAGKYIAFAYMLDGAAADNYKIDKTKTEADDAEVYNYKRDFVIKKQAIVKPTATKEFTFGENQSGVALDRGTTETGKDWAWLFNQTATYPKLQASIAALDSAGNAFAENAHGAEFATGKFTYENAGKYTITLTIGDTKNYCWANADDSADDTVIKTDIVVTIAKKALATPTATATATFDETNNTIQLTAGDGTTWADLAKRETYDPDIRGSVIGKDFFDTSISSLVAFDETKGEFTYTDAGVYTLTVTIGAPNNFYWGTDETVKETTITVTVNRKEISSPTIAEPYTVDWTGSAVCPSLATQPGIDSDKYNVVYGSVAVSGEGNDKTFAYNGNYGAYQSVDRGEYFIKFTLKNDLDGFNYKNYIWTAPYGKGSEDRGEYVQRKSHLEITADETTVYLHYAITNALLQVGFKFEDYTFGDNLTAGVLGTLLSAIDDETTESNEIDTFKSEMQSKNVQITVSFVGKNSDNNGSFIWNKFDAGSGTSASFTDPSLPWDSGSFFDVSDNLVNYLPWNADMYTVTILLRYSAASTYQDRDVTTTFEIKPFAISVNWSKDSDTISYDGSGHGPTATIDETKAPKLNGVSTVAGLSLDVGTDVNGTVYKKVKNARDTAYTFAVTAITGTPDNGNLASNFDFSEAKVATLTINKLDLTVTPNKAGHTYGDAFGAGTAFSLTSSGFIADEKEAGDKLFDFIVYKDGDATHADLSGNKLTPVSSDTVKYLVMLQAKTQNAELLNNYVVNCAATAEYTISKRNVTVSITDGLSSVYGEELKTPVTSVTSGNEVEGETAALFTLGIYESGTTPITKFSNIGKYNIVKEDNPNYVVALDNTYQYEITPATLTVSVNLVKYYGETVPDDFKKTNAYLYETKSGRNTGIYTIEDFARDDDKTAFYAQSNADLFSGSFDYTVNNDNTITFTSQNLTWGNYVFAGKEGELTVENLTVSVTVIEQSVTYYDNTNIPDIMTKDVGFTVAYSPSSFKDGAIVLSAEPIFADLFTLTTQAVISGKTNNVGEYDIVATVNEENTTGKYTVTFVNVGDNDTYAKYYKITPATLLNVKQLDNFNATFAQADITPNVANGETLAETVDSIDKGTTVSVKYLIGNGDNAPTDTDWESEGGNMPKFYHAGEYKVYYLIYADNHDSVVKSFTVNIGKATANSFNSHFNYEGKVAESVSTDMSIAWEYGSYKTFAQQVAYSDPVTVYYVKPDGSNAPILVTLYYSTDGSAWGAALKTKEELAHGSEIYKLLENEWNVSKFNAGYYKLVFEMDGNSNFDAPTPDERYFRIGKATLTVTPTGEYSTTYGESFDGRDDVTYSVAGYKLDDETNTPTDVTSALGAIVWTTKYSIGDHATSTDHAYIIEIDDKSAAKYSTQNYALDFETVDLQVDKRAVSIEINKDLAVYYNLYSYNAQSGTSPIYVDDAYTVTSSSFYNNEKPIKLVTEAYSVVDGQYKTNNVGDYEIKIAYNVRSDGSSFDVDYSIVYTVGTFKVNVSTIFAQIKVFDNINVSSKEYDGDPVAAELDSFDDKVSNDLKNSFTPKYYKGSDNKGEVIDAPYNAGEYFVEFIYAPADENEANNYLIFTAGKYFTITKINITIRVDTFETYNADNNMSIVYGSNKPATNAVAAGNGFSGLKYTLHYNNNNTALTEEQIGTIASFETEKGNKWDTSTLRFDIPSYTPNADANRALDVKITQVFDTTNFNFSTTDGRVQVVPRAIDVTINGVDQLATGDKKLAQGKYLAGQNDQILHLNGFNSNVASNLAKFFDPESGWNGSSDDVLSDLVLSFAYFDESLNAQSMTLDVGKYAIKGQYNNNNYIVTFAVPSSVGADGAVYYEVTPAPFTVKTIVTDSVTGKKSEVIYGNEISVTYEPVGYLHGQNFGDLVNAGKANGGVVHNSTYAIWTTGVGSYDVIHSSDPNNELWFKNYSVSYEKCTFTVVAREITVDDIKSVIYDEEADKTYNGGAKGKAQHAAVNFTDTAASQVIKGVSGDTANSSYDGTYGLPARGVGYTVSYVYSGNASETYANGAAPDKAGMYNVTITLTSACKNYKFATASIAKSYTIDKKEVSLNWNNGAVDFEDVDDDRSRYIANFKPDIMSVASFYRFSTDSEDVQEDTIEYIALGSYAPTDNYKYYTYNTSEERLLFKAYSAGYYTVRIVLNSASRRNYYINGDTDAYEIALRLVATTDHIEFSELRMDGNSWTYGTTAGTLKLVTSAGGRGFAISYAKFDRGNFTWDQVWAGFENTYFDNSGFGDISGWSGLNFTSQMPSDVGVYVLSAYYSATGQSRYCLFRITPQTIAAPTINSGAARDYTYTGSTLVFDVTGYNNQTTVDTGSLVVAPITGGIRVGATNVGSYPITVSIATENYVFATECGAWTRNDDSTLSYAWEITQAQEIITISDIERDYDGGNNYADPVTSTKFGGTITIHYAEKVDGTADSALTGWLTQKPTRVGTFAIRAVVEGTGNYLGDTKYATLVISPVELTVIPYGSMVYGETFNQSGTSAYGVRYSGFVGNDSENNVTFAGRVTYDIERNGATGLLDARTYSMSVDVSGYTTANYTIVGGTGEFVVTPKKITVEIIGSSSTYGDTVDASSLVSRYRVIGYEIAPELLGIVPALVGVDDYAHLDARSYSVVADSYTNSNFDITFTPGTYTVDPLRITIGAIDVENGEVDVITAPSITSWIWHGENNAVGSLTAAQVAELVYGFVYTDSASGEEMTFDELRTTVGSYYVLVTQSNPNYWLTGQTTYSFRVLARTVDGTQITIADLAFNNSVQAPVIDFGDYNPSLFEVTYLGDRTNVGTHYVILSLGDNPNYSWSESTSREYRIPFEIVRGDNALVSLDINGWVFGEYKAAENSPVAVTRFGSSSEHIFNYYVKNGDAYERLTGVPVNAGTYYVTVTVPLAPNYNAFTSEYVSFEIAKAIHVVPTLNIITEGEGKNDTYTGEALPAVVLGFDSSEMSIHYDGISNINGNVLTVYATDANTYTIRLALKNDGNYRWAESAALDDGYALLTWTIAKKKIAVPTDNTGRFVVNGSMLTYIPDGFDESIMSISGNTTSYGGTFRVTVTLKDPSNYEWIVEEDGVVRNAYDFTWNVVGADTVFSIVMGILGGLFGAAAVAVLVQFIIHKKRIGGHKAEAAATAAGNGNAPETAATTAETTADNSHVGEGE